ncbi:alpha/beta hydrolase family protein [Xanthovirga aplysinae]|uniref:alpha/beta hydrolase family protein n=1 Tax=Xanthovirga aplysinae TaxID=2529853 RepID=UPI0012BCBA26|nr:alpha/beta hydrolase [Xanthovirga aplysinae]MTI30857.1 alpha/beta hydrolase [Xanthovirga aplysinae]
MLKKLKLVLFLLIASFGVAKSLPPNLNDSAASIGIDTTEIINIGGIKQFISIKSKDRTKPLLLYLHGGPGESVMNKAETFTSELQNYFVVIHWDQRETGKTKELNSSPTLITAELMQNDTEEIIEHLLKKFKRNKLFLVGHSWGTFLGFHIANQSPQLLHAYIAISPMVNPLESEKISLNMLKEHAKQTNNERAIKELSTVQIPFEKLDDILFSRKWLFSYIGQPVPDSVMTKVRQYLIPWESTWLSVFNEAGKQNLLKTMPSIECPVYFFAGRKDYQTNFKITEEYYNQLKAPKKNLFWFEKSAHGIPNTEPALMQEVIINKILPETI